VLVDQPDQLATDLTHQDHPDHVDRLRRGHAQAAAELRGQPQPVQHRGDLRAAAVHDDREDPGSRRKTMSGRRPA
jgi:hypothetical protein